MTYAWAPQPGPQAEAISATWCAEMLYGGAVFGGKSDFLLGDYLQDVPTYGDAWPGVLFRRTMGELEDLITRSKEIYPQTGGSWAEQKKTWTWPNGATLKMRYLESDDDVLRYQGHAYSWIGWDELGQWASMFPYRYLRSRLRCAKREVPTKRIRASANPGGPGHQWIKAYFINPAPLGMQPFRDPETDHEVMYVPSRLRDNTIGMMHDPGYEKRLDGMGSPELVRALKDGDWDVVAGAFFPEFSTARHVIAPRSLPSYWHRFRSADWGSARPFAVYWWAVSDGELPEFPRGALIAYREWYGMEPGKPNVGLRMTAEQVADGILQREKDDLRDKGTVMSGVADPAIFAEDGGPSIASRMAARGCYFTPADNKRVPQRGAMGGWDQVRARLIGDEGKPAIYFFSTCVDIIRTLPALQHDADRPEDCDSDAEDHGPDAVRYGCVSRPYVVARPAALAPRDRYRDGRVKQNGGRSAWAA